MAANSVELSPIIEYADDIADALPPEPLPAGRDYRAEVTKTRVIPSKSNPDKANVEVTFYIPPSEFPIDYDPENAPDGVTLVTFVSTAQDRMSRYRMSQLVKSLNVSTGRAMDVTTWVGAWASLRIRHGEFNGIKKAEIERIGAV